MPINAQFEFIPKIIAFDRNFEQRTDNVQKVKIGVLYSGIVKNSKRIKDGIENQVKNQKIRKLEIDYVYIDISNKSELNKLNDFYAVYITPIRGIDISGILKVCSDRKILSITGEYAHYETGASVYLYLSNNKPKIGINLDSSINEGCQFSAQLLKLAVVKQ